MWRFYFNLKYALNWKKPLLVLRIVQQVVRAALGKMPLRYVDFALDFTCNQHCQHCFARTYDHQKEKGRNCISSDQYRKIIREAINLGAVSFSIQGGEPLALMKKTEELVSLIPVKSCLVSLKTNGTLLNLKNSQHLKKLGVDILTVSLDSAFSEEHDEFRGMKGAYERALQGIDFAQNAGLKVIVGCTLFHQNIRSPGVLRLVELCREWKVLLFFIKAAPSGKWEGNESVLLTEEDSQWIDEVVKNNPHCRTDFEANFLHYGCGALKEILYINQYGDVMSCPFIQVSFGNAIEESVQTIRERGLKNKFFSQFSDKCLIAEDKEFLDRYLEIIPGRSDLPISSSEFFASKKTSKKQTTGSS